MEFGEFLLKQICGVPMGSIPAPDLASLALSVDEYQFVDRMFTAKAYSLLRKLNHM